MSDCCSFKVLFINIVWFHDLIYNCLLCSNGGGRTGAYILLDLVLGRMNKGAREIDIAATLEHLRDQRSGLVETRQQFEFVLTAVAEEVHAILKALPQSQSTEKRELDKETVKEQENQKENEKPADKPANEK